MKHFSFQKPRSIDRLYTEIIPTETDVFENGSQLAQSFGHVTQPNPHKLAQMSYCQTTNQIANQMTNRMNGSQMMSTNEITCNNSNVDWFHQNSFKIGNFREDSGVHTAQNRLLLDLYHTLTGLSSFSISKTQF